jgi:hypothetical protein
MRPDTGYLAGCPIRPDSGYPARFSTQKLHVFKETRILDFKKVSSFKL